MNLNSLISKAFGLSWMALALSAFAADDPLPIGQSLSPDYVGENMLMTEVIPEGNPDLTFRMLIPKGWVQDELPGMGQPLSAEQFMPLLAIRNGAEERATVVFHVQALKLVHELRARHLWEFSGRQFGQRPLAMRELSAWFVDSLMAQSIGTETVHVRQAILISGRRGILLSGIAPEPLYPEFAEQFGLMVASFQPAVEPDNPHVENWLRDELGDRLSFGYPESWQLQHIDIDDGAALRLHWNDPDGTLNSQIGLEREARLLPKAHAFELIVGLMSEAGLEMSDEFETITLDMVDSPLDARGGRVYRANQVDRGRTWTVRMMLFEVAGESIRVWQIQPESETDFLRWAISTRALQIVLSTMELASPSRN